MSAFIVALAGSHKEDPAEKAGKAVDNATEKAAQQIVKADDNIQDTANGDKKSECRNDKMGYQTSFKLTIPIRLKVRCSVKRPLECPLRGAGVGRMETVRSRRTGRPQCATDIRNNWRQPVHFGISIQSQVAAFISGFVPSPTSNAEEDKHTFRCPFLTNNLSLNTHPGLRLPIQHK